MLLPETGAEGTIVMAIPAIIDADIHPAPDPARVAERLPEPWRRRYLSGNHGPGYLNYWNPNGVHRSDAVTEDRGAHRRQRCTSRAPLLRCLQDRVRHPQPREHPEHRAVAGARLRGPRRHRRSTMSLLRSGCRPTRAFVTRSRSHPTTQSWQRERSTGWEIDRAWCRC